MSLMIAASSASRTAALAQLLCSSHPIRPEVGNVCSSWIAASSNMKLSRQKMLKTMLGISRNAAYFARAHYFTA
jgi:hypothetical protein